MPERTAEQDRGATLAPGDVIALDTPSGTRHVQVTHAQAPYPDVVRAIHPVKDANEPAKIAGGKTAFAAMVELSRSLCEKPQTTSLIGRADIPEACRAYPTFRVPIRNREGEIVYWWTWDGEGLAIAPPATDTDLPLREVIPIETLRARLAELTG